MAWKRIASALGRWLPWDPPSWDYAYNKNFATGKPGGNVGVSGILGIQRQQPELGETGFVGEAFYHFALCARIPEGLPNAGRAACDTTSLNLLAAARQRFGGVDPRPPEHPLRELALHLAAGEVGYVEGPNNDTPYGRWYGVNNQPWCAIFCSWAYETAGGSPSFVKGSRYAYCPYIYSDAAACRYGLSLTSSPVPGDLVLYNWDDTGGEFDHVGLFEDGSSSSWQAIEGNTSPSNSGSQSNGGGVYRRSRHRSDTARVAFVRVAEP